MFLLKDIFLQNFKDNKKQTKIVFLSVTNLHPQLFC